MAILTGLMRLGRDAELRYLADSTAVANLSLAYNYGRKGQDGNRPTQWIEAAIFGKQAEALSQYLLKGTLHSFILNDVRIEEYQKKDGSAGTKLAARVQDVELGPRQGGNSESMPAQNSAGSANSRSGGFENNPPRERKPQPQSQSFDDLESDLPF
jgi:single-strand DNA-binding protein